LYEVVGGMVFFEDLVDRFYEGVASDPELLALYPHPEDLAPARRRLTLFLAQYWGGPAAYSDERGHPRLRMRHAPFPIDAEARDRWLTHMREAVDALGPTADLREALLSYFGMAAEGLRNTGR
jgi:hemoglobin